MRYILIALLLLPSIKLFAETNVGVIIPLAGDFARYGERVRDGILSAKSTDLKYFFDDEKCSPSVAVTAYKNLSALHNVNFFLGPWCGSPQTAVAPLIKSAGQLAILGSSAPRRVFEVSGGRMFSTQHSIEEESIFNAQQIEKAGAKRVVIVFFDNDFSRAHEAAFRAEFKGEVVETMTYTSVDSSSIKPIVSRIRRLHPDALYVPDAYPLMHGIMKDLRNMGLKNLPVYSVYSAESKPVAEAVGKYGEGLILSYPQIGSEEALVHFPKLAAEILAAGLNACPKKEADCVIDAIKSAYPFDQYGVLEGKLGLKTLQGGSFVWYQ